MAVLSSARASIRTREELTAARQQTAKRGDQTVTHRESLSGGVLAEGKAMGEHDEPTTKQGSTSRKRKKGGLRQLEGETQVVRCALTKQVT